MAEEPARRARVLVCDDEAVLRALVRASLEPTYEIVEAVDGNESVRIARELRPDAIVLDMMMPGKTGLEVLAELRADADFDATPVVMLTARAQAADRAAAADGGADRYLAKPFSPSELARTVAELLQP
jgi:two-component system OmpR family response regulator